MLDFFIEQVDDGTVNTIYEVVWRLTNDNLVVCTDVYVPYKNIKEKMPEIVVKHHVVIHLKIYRFRHVMTTNNIEGI